MAPDCQISSLTTDARLLSHPLTVRPYCSANMVSIVFMSGLAGYVQQIETKDPIEARRSRYAQYRGLVATLTFGSATVRGMVQSVKQDSTCTPIRWLITIAPQQPRATS